MLEESGTALLASDRDYAVWDAAWDYVHGRKPDFIGVDLTADSLQNADLSAVVVVLADGSVLWSAARPAPESTDEFAPLDPATRASLLASVSVSPDDTTGVAGLAWVGETPWQVASAPILPSDSTGTPAGRLIFARTVDADALAHLSRVVGAEVSLSRAPPTESPEGATVATAPLGDADAPDALVSVARAPRPDRNGSREQLVLLVNLVATTLAGIVALAFAVDRILLRRLADLAQLTARIRRERAPGLRLPVRGSDELDQLASGVNALLDQVDHTAGQLRHDALHDPLTGLGNRTLLADRLDLALAQGARRERPGFSLLFVDLDGLKAVNDQLGHSAGDHLIASVAQRLRSAVRPGDTVARLGGDEFAVLLTDIADAALARDRGERLLARIREPLQYGARTLDVTASVGVAIPEKGHDRDRLLKEADTAMYAAKARGGNRVAIYEPALRGQRSDRAAIEGDLRAALGDGSLQVRYQSIVDLRNGRLVALEAFAAWAHGSHGDVPADVFLGIAEESDLVVAVDRYVLRRSLGTLARLRRTVPGLAVSVNHSARQMSSPDLVRFVQESLDEHALPATALHLELTETMLTRNEERWADAMRELQERGVTFALDDFGMGWSSLHRLQHLPVGELKLDRVFVAGLATGREPISRAILNLATELGRPVVAEGVEEAWQRDRLAAMGCNMAQGWLFGRPVPEEQVGEILRREPAN